MAKILSAILLILLLSGCSTITLPVGDGKPENTVSATAAAVPPGLWVTYLPYPDLNFMDEANIRPIPAYTGWTNLRMERDAEMMKYCGVDGILVKAAPAQLADANFQERFKAFGRIMKQAGGPGITIFLVSGKAERLSVRKDNILRYLARIGYHAWDGILKQNHHPVILTSTDIALAGDDLPDCPIKILSEGKDFPVRPFGTVTDQTQLNQLNGFTRLRAGESAGSTDFSRDGQRTNWILPRLRGEALEIQLELCRKNPEIKTIILDSWNNYKDGSHVEPDSMTRSLFVEILEESL